MAVDADVVKVAWTARSLRDCLEAFELPGLLGVPTVALCMGPFGLPSRVLAPKFGGFLTFAALDADLATAPGQPTLAQLMDLYRFRSIDTNTETISARCTEGPSMEPEMKKLKPSFLRTSDSPVSYHLIESNKKLGSLRANCRG